jgi:TRAP-type C4-dicarboxylate transport system permease small subunit
LNKGDMMDRSAPRPSVYDFTRWCAQNPVEFAGALLTATLTVIVFLQVLFRYALKAPLDWSEELAMFLFQWCVYVGAAIAVRRTFHYHLDIVTRRLPERTRNVLALLASVCIFITSYAMIHLGISMMLMVSPQEFPVMHFSMSYGYLPIPVSGILMFVFQLRIFFRQVNQLFKR